MISWFLSGLIGSATLVQSLTQTGLIDEYKLLVHPAIAGSGRRFFKDGLGTSKLKFLESETLSLGVVLLRYAPVK
jgi:dihydrofolate reductase